MRAEVLTQAIGPASDRAVYKQTGRRKRSSGPVMTLVARRDQQDSDRTGSRVRHAR